MKNKKNNNDVSCGVRLFLYLCMLLTLMLFIAQVSYSATNCGVGSRVYVNNYSGLASATYSFDGVDFRIAQGTTQEHYCKGNVESTFPATMRVRVIPAVDAGSVASYIAGLAVAYLMYKFIRNLLADRG